MLVLVRHLVGAIGNITATEIGAVTIGSSDNGTITLNGAIYNHNWSSQLRWSITHWQQERLLSTVPQEMQLSVSFIQINGAQNLTLSSGGAKRLDQMWLRELD